MSLLKDDRNVEGRISELATKICGALARENEDQDVAVSAVANALVRLIMTYNDPEAAAAKMARILVAAVADVTAGVANPPPCHVKKPGAKKH
jgi:hypothetical protein